MPMLNGYSVYVGAPATGRKTWVVRVYRDSDDEHLHSAEECSTLGSGMAEAVRAINEDLGIHATSPRKELS